MGQRPAVHESDLIRLAIACLIHGRLGTPQTVYAALMALGPDRLLVAARIDLRDGLSSDEIERASNEIDQELRRAVPSVGEVFLDATHRRESTPRD